MSYNKADKKWAEWIAWQLEEFGHSTVLQVWDFRPGSSWPHEMRNAMNSAERTVAVLSPDFLDSKYTAPEWYAAFVEDPTGEKRLLVPVRVRKGGNDRLLKQFSYIELVDLDEAQARDELLAGINKDRSKPSKAPPFPGVRERSVPTRPEFPRNVPAVWSIPQRRNLNFVGRDLLLSEISAVLNNTGSSPSLVALHGLGGVGKTQLAIEYVYQHLSDYDLVWWLRAAEPSTLAADFTRLGRTLYLVQSEEEHRAVATETVLRHLGQTGRWLLIFDKAEDPATLAPYIPATGGDVVVTSINASWRSIAHPIEVREFSKDESIDFLAKRTGKREEAALELAVQLGNLPLALEQAGAYIEENSLSIAEYSQLFRRHHARLMGMGSASPPDSSTVATTWDLSFQRVKQQSPGAADLLKLCAFLADEAFPVKAFREGTAVMPGALSKVASNELELNRALATIRRYSLLRVSDGDERSISMHRLVQVVTRERMNGKERRKWTTAALRLVHTAWEFDPSDAKTWDRQSAMLGHVLASEFHAEQLEIAPELRVDLLTRVGAFLDESDQVGDAWILAERALQTAEALVPPNPLAVSTALTVLGMAARGLGEIGTAVRLHERALSIAEDAFGLESLTTAQALTNLGSTKRMAGDFNAARDHLERAVGITRERLGAKHVDLTTPLGNLGNALGELGHFQRARALLEEALTISAINPSDSRIEVARNLKNLAEVLRQLGEYDEALTRIRSSFDILEDLLGPDHIRTALARLGIGAVLRDMGDLDGARSAFELALPIIEEVLGPDHFEVARVLEAISLVQADQGDLDAAVAGHQRTLQIRHEWFGENHPMVAFSLLNLSVVLLNLGDAEQSVQLGSRAVEIVEDALNEEHPDLSPMLNSVGHALLKLNRLQEAHDVFVRSLAIGEQSLGSGHPRNATYRLGLALSLRQLGNAAEAEVTLKEALSLARNALSPGHRVIVDIENALSS